MQPVIALVGPTASGKTALSLRLAAERPSAILSADSRQVYKGMDIGTEKIASRSVVPATHKEPLLYNGIPHFLLDILLPSEPYSAAAFASDALPILETLHAQNTLPLVVGGTYFYIRHLFGKSSVAAVLPDEEFRKWAAAQPLPRLVGEIAEKDPTTALRIDTKNPHRVIRALEIIRANGTRTEHKPVQRPWKTLFLALHQEKEVLQTRIRERVKNQFQRGLEDEVCELVERYGMKSPGLQTIGYREWFPYILGHGTREEVEEHIYRSTWAYVKRQYTWLRKEKEIVWCASKEEAQRIVSDFVP